MSTVKNLSNEEAIEKLKDLAEGKMCLMCTKENGQLDSRPMGATQVDQSGDIWFFSAKSSNKNRQIAIYRASERVSSGMVYCRN